MKPPISGKELIKLLEKQGFIVLRQTGSHVFLEDQKIILEPLFQFIIIKT